MQELPATSRINTKKCTSQKSEVSCTCTVLKSYWAYSPALRVQSTTTSHQPDWQLGSRCDGAGHSYGHPFLTTAGAVTTYIFCDVNRNIRHNHICSPELKIPCSEKKNMVIFLNCLRNFLSFDWALFFIAGFEPGWLSICSPTLRTLGCFSSGLMIRFQNSVWQCLTLPLNIV